MISRRQRARRRRSGHAHTGVGHAVAGGCRGAGSRAPLSRFSALVLNGHCDAEANKRTSVRAVNQRLMRAYVHIASCSLECKWGSFFFLFLKGLFLAQKAAY